MRTRAGRVGLRLAVGLTLGIGPVATARPAAARAPSPPQSIWVQFKAGSSPRVEAGALVVEARDAASLAGVSDMDARWEVAIPGVDPLTLTQLHARAQPVLRTTIDSPNDALVARVGSSAQASELLEALNAIDAFAWAEVMPDPVPSALPPPPGAAAPAPPPAAPPSGGTPNFELQQGYRLTAPRGVGAALLSDMPGALGQGVTIADVEYSWNLAHTDLPSVALVGPAPVDPFGDTNHGTAVLGVLGARADGVGVTGIAPAAALRVAAANTAWGYNLPAAIAAATSALAPGDILLVQQQMVGPNYTGVPAGSQVGLVPPEWQRATYNAILTAIGNGIVVVTAGGNGGQNLDEPAYAVAPGGHAPFRPWGDSGSIIVGGGAADPGSTTARSRLAFSNHGAAISLQGWGERVWSTGYGDSYSAGGGNSYYTSSFLGTSSAAAMVAGSAAVLQSSYKAQTGLVLTPREVRDLLKESGSAQQGGAFPLSQSIGPLPDVRGAIELALVRAPLAPAAFSVGAVGDLVPEAGLAFSWDPALRASSYRVQVDTRAGFGAPLLDEAGLTQTSWAPPAGTVPLGRALYVRILASNSFGQTISSEVRPFSVAPSWCPGDADGDLRVNFGDLTAVILSWGGSGPRGDANADGRVNGRDVSAVLVSWGSACP